MRRRAAGLTTMGHHAEALPLWAELSRLRPQDRGVRVALGIALLECERGAEALDAFARLGEADPDDAQVAFLTGLALLQLKAGAAAIGAFYHALALRPGDAGTHAMLAAALLADGALDAAAEHGREAFRLAPTAAHATTLSCICLERGAIAEALAIADEGLAERGKPSAELMVNRSIALECLGDGAGAVESAQRALRASRTATVEHHMAALLLSQGQLTARAWALFEARLALPHARRTWPEGVRWTGQDVVGKTVLLHAEQGLGDTLQFVRYVPLVVARGARVVLVVQPALKRLLSRGTGAAVVLAVGETLPPFDLFAPLLSLPGVFGTTLDTIPAPVAYPGTAARRRAGRLRVGLVWAGSEAFVEDRKRSVPATSLWRLACTANVEAFSLQQPSCALPDDVTDLLCGVRDMADTAARLAMLDLVVSVDTSVAHLAATMGKPVWLLSRFRGCWRWLDGRTDSPWYPTLTIYRQERSGDWEPVLRTLGRDLEDLAMR